MKLDKAQALQSLRPGAQWVLRDNELEWLEVNETTEPTEEELQAEIERLQADYDAKEYQRLRKAEYDKLNQFEMQFDDQLNGTTNWIDTINIIKAKYPKPSEESK